MNNDISKSNSFYRCEKCKQVIAENCDSNEFRTKSISKQDVIISDISICEITAICRKCGYKNYWNGKYEQLTDDMTEIYLEDEKLGLT